MGNLRCGVSLILYFQILILFPKGALFPLTERKAALDVASVVEIKERIWLIRPYEREGVESQDLACTFPD